MIPLQVTFSAAKSPTTGYKTSQPVWDYLFGHISPDRMNRIGLPQVKKYHIQTAEVYITRAVETDLIPVIQENLWVNDHVFTKRLHDSFTTFADGEGTVSLISTVPYALAVERGTMPRPVNADERQRLVKWAEFKKIEGEARAWQRRDPQTVAKFVAKAIEKHGNEAHPYIQPALDRVQGLLINNIAIEFKG